MDKIKHLKAMLQRRHLSAALVTGGGTLAREYIDFARGIGIRGDRLHEIGIRSPCSMHS
jgi:hypothetical protein